MSSAVYQKMIRSLAPTVLHNLTPPSPGVDVRATDVLVENVQHLGSYTWTDDAEPTILVPGSPRIWTDRATPFRLELADQKSVSQKWHSHDTRGPTGFAPLFAALDAQQARVQWPSLDMIMDRATLRNLLAWISRRSHNLAFRIDLQPVGENTVLFNRWVDPDLWALTVHQPGYGISFEEEATKTPSGCEGGIGHYRIIQYDFCELKMAVRFEVDAYLPADEVETPDSRYVDLPQSCDVNEDPAALQDGSTRMNIKVIHAGTPVPQNALLELKCLRAHINNPYWNSAMTQMYFSATSHLYLGLHMDRTCVRIEKHFIDPAATFETLPDLPADFWQLGTLLHTLRHLALTVGRVVPLSIVGYGGELRVYERIGGDSGTWMLPEEEKKRFE